MKIITQQEAIHVDKPEGVIVDYYLRDEYEVHFNEQAPGSRQTWHHHEVILETLFILQGELTAQWRDADRVLSQVVRVGDLIETGNIPHTFINHTSEVAKFIVIKQVLAGENKRKIFEKDKVID